MNALPLVSLEHGFVLHFESSAIPEVENGDLQCVSWSVWGSQLRLHIAHHRHLNQMWNPLWSHPHVVSESFASCLYWRHQISFWWWCLDLGSSQLFSFHRILFFPVGLCLWKTLSISDLLLILYYDRMFFVHNPINCSNFISLVSISFYAQHWLDIFFGHPCRITFPKTVVNLGRFVLLVWTCQISFQTWVGLASYLLQTPLPAVHCFHYL